MADKITPQTNVFAAILAGGSGSRMGSTEQPKQFLQLGDRPVLVHTLEKFCVHGGFERIVVVSPAIWIAQMQDIVRRWCPTFSEKITIVAGGDTRNESIMCAVRHIEENYATDSETLLVTHDAVRPFVSLRMIDENIEVAREYGACDTVIPAADTIVQSSDGEQISAIPDRSGEYLGQTPQSFRLHELHEAYDSLTDQQKAILTDACKVMVLTNHRVQLVRGDVSNMKITYPVDMRIAAALLEEAGA